MPRGAESPPRTCCQSCFLGQPRAPLAFWAAKTHCQVILTFSSINVHKFFPQAALSTCSTLSLYLCLGLSQPRCQTLPWALLNFRRFAQTHHSSLSPSGQNPTLPVCWPLEICVQFLQAKTLHPAMEVSKPREPFWPPYSLYLEICPGNSPHSTGRIRVTFLNILCHQAGRSPGLSTHRLPA